MIDTLDDLVRKNSKYTLVVAIAKRARELMDGAPMLIESRAHKPVTMAMEEMFFEKLELYHPEQDGAK